jgi:indolepyruvate ferredoxin oxidoreductase, beta subunit
MAENRKSDILIAGVGGQGILLCSNLIGEACVTEGIPVKGAETHGMSQRGGSVEVHIRVGCIYGPMIPAGKADFLIALEPLEGARYSPYLKRDGLVFVNERSVQFGRGYKVNQQIEIIRRRTSRIISGDFTGMVMELGNVKILNVFMLGIASVFIPLKSESFQKSIKKVVRKEFVDINLKAFRQGRHISSRQENS